jgi:hypothetical protein
MTQPITTTDYADIDTLRRVIEQSDAASLTGLYADDAEIRVIDKAHTPRAPMVLRGKDAIADFYRDVCGRAMTHHLDDAVAGPDHLAFTESCQYPDGTRVVCAAMLELRNGKIVRQTNVQAWDE